MFTISESPPSILMEEDDEIELCIIRPILEDLINKVPKEHSITSLKRFVAMNMEQVQLEKEQTMNQHMVEDILLDVIGKAVTKAKTKKGNFLISLPLFRSLMMIFFQESKEFHKMIRISAPLSSLLILMMIRTKTANRKYSPVPKPRLSERLLK